MRLETFQQWNSSPSHVLAKSLCGGVERRQESSTTYHVINLQWFPESVFKKPASTSLATTMQYNNHLSAS